MSKANIANIEITIKVMFHGERFFIGAFSTSLTTLEVSTISSFSEDISKGKNT